MKERLVVTIEEELYHILKEKAAAENRNLSNFVETLILKALDEDL